MRKLWLKDVYDNLGWQKTLLINLVLDQLHIFVRAQRDRLDEGFLEASGRGTSICEYSLQVDYSKYKYTSAMIDT